jgi:hypothetical protein
MKYIWYAILAYLLYQLIFKLVIPVYLTTRKLKKGFREMHSRMEEQMRQQQQAYEPDEPGPDVKPKNKAGDYIDFEEVK